MVSPEVTVFISIRIKNNNIYTSWNMANIQAGGQKDGQADKWKNKQAMRRNVDPLQWKMLNE